MRRPPLWLLWLPVTLASLLLGACQDEAAGPPAAASARSSAAPVGSQASATSSSSGAASAATAAAASPLLGQVTDVAVGSKTSCARREDGTVWCWSGGSPARQVAGITDVKQVVVVEGYACTLSAKGKLACTDASSGKTWELPVYRDGIIMAGGHETFCVRTEDGVLRGNVLDSATREPKPPQGMPGLKDPRAFAVGWAMGCALVDADLWCWNTEKGHGMPKTMPPIQGARSLATGRQRSCVDTEAGEVWCHAAAVGAKAQKLDGWSDVTALSMSYGQDAPDGLCALRKDGSVGCALLAGEGDGATFGAPVAVAGLPKVLQLATGDSVLRCARTESGNVWCWGRDGAPAAPVGVAPAP